MPRAQSVGTTTFHTAPTKCQQHAHAERNQKPKSYHHDTMRQQVVDNSAERQQLYHETGSGSYDTSTVCTSGRTRAGSVATDEAEFSERLCLFPNRILNGFPKFCGALAQGACFARAHVCAPCDVATPLAALRVQHLRRPKHGIVQAWSSQGAEQPKKETDPYAVATPQTCCRSGLQKGEESRNIGTWVVGFQLVTET